jgi:hypothetical protein
VRASAGSYAYQYANYGTPPDLTQMGEPSDAEPRITVTR